MIKGKNILVYGLGKTGIETVKFLLLNGANVFVYDDKFVPKIKNTIVFDCKKDFFVIDFAVLSPGVSNTETVKKLVDNNIKLISEIELASWFIKKSKIIAITGTNGKTTTTKLVGQILKRANIPVTVCGNVGEPLIKFVNQDFENHFFVVEVSSFQLERTFLLKPFISAILNLTPDHLNRHSSMQEYEKIKFSITKNQNKKDFCILNYHLIKKAKRVKAKKIFFNFNNKNQIYIKNNQIYYKNELIIDKKDIFLCGEKNLENILASIVITKLCGVKNEVICEGIKGYKPEAHKLEKLGEINGVVFVNDSKATNVASTICALEVFESPIILFLGGSDKEFYFDEIFEFKNKIKHIFAFGQTKKKIYESALKNNYLEIDVLDNLKQAFEKSLQIANVGDVVLLSPACASFDQFENYEDRGNKFKRLFDEQKQKEV